MIPSFPMPGSSDRLPLAESVAVAMEIKSDLSSQWSDVQSKTKAIRTLNRNLNPVMWFTDGPPAEQTP